MSRSIQFFIVFVACAALGWQPAVSQAQSTCLDYRDYPLLETNLELPGEAYRMATSSIGGQSYLFVAGGASGLQVVKIQNNGTAVTVGSYNSPGQARAVTVAGHLLYLADGDRGLIILDISNPASPQLVGEVNTLGFVNEAVVRDNLAYLAAAWGSGGLIIVDVADPAAPSVLSTTPAGGDERGLVLRGNHAYLADFSGQVHVFDVTDPLVPVAVDQITTISEPTSIALSGDQLVVSCYFRGIQVFELTDPAHPQLVSSFGPDQGLPFYYGTFVSCEDNLACVAGTDYEVTLIDLTNPAAPVYDRTIDLDHGSPKVLLSSAVVFAAFQNDGLEIKSLEGWGDPTPIGSVSQQANFAPGPIVADGNWAVVASYQVSGDNSLQMVNMQNETLYSVPGSITHPHRVFDIALKDHHVFAAYTSNLLVVDILDPTNPLIVANLEIPHRRQLEISGNLLYTAGFGGLLTFDVTDPANPLEIDSGFFTTFPSGMALAGDRLYVAGGTLITTYDLSDPTEPLYLGEMEITTDTYSIQDLQLQGNYLYVSLENLGLQIRYRNYPSLPVVSQIDLPDPRHVSFDGDYAYISDLNRGLVVADISDPVQPEVLGLKNGEARASLVHDGRLLLSGQGFIRGLESIPLQCDLASPVDEVPVAVRSGLSVAPNPFNPQTRIRLRVEQDGPVDLAVYDVAGRKVRLLLSGQWLTRGEHEVNWNGRDGQGRGLPSGTYFLRMRRAGQVLTRPVTLLK